jgi:hypothetical protein
MSYIVLKLRRLFRWTDKLGYEKCIHQVTIEEIAKTQDTKAREAFLTKIESYHRLPTKALLKPKVLATSRKYDTTEKGFEPSA